MFGQLLFMRLRAAEKALSEGRLEEAHRLATQPDIRAHKRGIALLGGLTEKLVARAREYYRSDKFSEALMDLDRAEAGGQMKQEIEQLRGYIRTVAAEQARKEDSQAGRLQQARQRIERGSLAAGQNLLAQVEEGHKAADALKVKAKERAADVEGIVAQVRKLMDSAQWASAADRLRRAKNIDAHATEITELETKLTAKIFQNAKAAFDEGMLTRAANEISTLGDLGKSWPARSDLQEALRLARLAADCLREHNYIDARRHALSLSRLAPDARWVNTIADNLKQLTELYTTVSAGPLGDRFPDGKTSMRPAPAPMLRHRLEDTVAVNGVLASAPGDASDGLPKKLLLLVDGGGSYLLVRANQASLGRVASEIPADIPLFSDISERHANLNRVDDDYFLFSGKDAEIGGRRVQQALLRDGDKVVLGKKAKFTFRLPSRKSTSALLELSDTTKMPNDVRKVILFSQIAMIGQSNNVHIYCRHAGPTLLLYERGGSFWLRAQSDGFVDTTAVELHIGEPVELGGVSMVLQAWKAAGREVA